MKITKEYSRVTGPRKMYGAVTLALDASTTAAITFDVDLSKYGNADIFRKSICVGINQAIESFGPKTKQAPGFRVLALGTSKDRAENVPFAYQIAAYEAAEALLKSDSY